MKTFYPGSQLQSQASRQQGSQQTGTKWVSAGGADQVSKATETPTVLPIARKRESRGSEVSRAKVCMYNYADYSNS